MRPDRFQRILVETTASIPGVTGVKTLAETGHTAHPYGITVEAGGRTSRWQIIAASAPGDSYASEEPEPRLGEPLPKPELPELTSDLSSVVSALISAMVRDDPGEIARVELYADRAVPPAVGLGATIDFHDSSKIFLNAIR